MKYFTEPNGLFVIKIPVEWQYKNYALGYEEKSPFGFDLYENPVGAFQISCYTVEENPKYEELKTQKSDKDNLEFLKMRMDDEEFNMQLWYAKVEDYIFMAKYIYDSDKEDDSDVLKEIEKAEKALSTLELISPKNRHLAVEIDKYEKFLGSLAASFDLKNKALENESFIEFSIIVANQIDAYLRMCLVLKKQLNEKTSSIDISLLFQGESDRPIMERKIYKQARNLSIINESLFNKLESLYKERNKMVHRYIITEFRTRDLYEIAFSYENICEEVRLILQALEDEQFEKQIGMHGKNRNPRTEHTIDDIRLIHSQVNDKHLTENFERTITSNNKKK